ncbi:hypothetical protein PG999_014300 [Apiospora kogelbergensis]|uniref:Mpv17 / PMP22 family protein n=1 Tax=Apiospora kogelbergensis TaxID=1337665 RepID=A0AAW0Q7U5_9PEZI
MLRWFVIFIFSLGTVLNLPRYQRKLASHPTLTQGITTVVLFGAGDCIAQQFVEKRGLQNHELARTGRMALNMAPSRVKMVQVSPTQSRAPEQEPGNGCACGGGSDAFRSDESFVFLSSMSVMEGSSLPEKLETSYTTALTRNWMVWPFVQLVNFRFVPLEHRIILVNVVLLGWNSYLSYINSIQK